MGRQYITIEDLKKRFGEIDIEELSHQSGIEAVSVIASVSALIDGYVAPRYRLPLVNEYELLKDACSDIVYYRLYNVQPPENVRKRYEDAIALLEKVSSGKIALNEPSGEEPQSRGKIYVKKKPRRFTMEMWID